VDEVVKVAVAAMGRRDWGEVTRVLHPYLHWTVGGTTIRGRRNVLAHLETAPPPDPPTSYEVRDGQIYRWTGP
jgi:hypothetical protein